MDASQCLANFTRSIQKEIWPLVENVWLSRGKGDIPDWPAWCFLPWEPWLLFTKKQLGSKNLSDVPHLEVAKFAALGTWRYSQGVYRFHDDMFNALVVECQHVVHPPNSFDAGGFLPRALWGR